LVRSIVAGRFANRPYEESEQPEEKAGEIFLTAIRHR
jgi:hypothetical protein